MVGRSVQAKRERLVSGNIIKVNPELLCVHTDPATGQVGSVTLFGAELLDTSQPCQSELWVNGHPLALRPHTDPNQPEVPPHLKGERYTDHFSGWGLVLARQIGGRAGLKHPCVGIQSYIRRELCDQTCPVPGPGGPVVEAPLWVDTFSVLNWNWKFWGDDTRMIFPTSHSNGPSDEWGHVGYEHDTPENCKKYLKNVWRRIYPGALVIHGGLFYNASTDHWLAITCRQAQVGYILNMENAGRGASYDFTLHAQFPIGESLQLPEIKLYYGETRETMMSWLADYAGFHYHEPPEWVFKTAWHHGLAWNNKPTWTEQADFWESEIARGQGSGIGYSLVTNRPIQSGTTPLGYEPDPNHGTREEFVAMCRRLADKGVPLLIWMSHSGLLYQGGPEIDDDWFIRGIDNRVCGAWGQIDGGGLTTINPGHPGYIEYTKKWIRFYIGECGAKGIFFDCLSWAFPPDYRPRPWMRYPGDTNRQAIKFMREAYACIKECDPEAIMLGEGASLEGPVNVFSIHANPRRGIDRLGPRDFFLGLNQYGAKRFVIDQGPNLAPGSGFCTLDPDPERDAVNGFITKLMAQRGGRTAFTPLPGDYAMMDDMVIVPTGELIPLQLPAPWDEARRLADVVTGEVAECATPGRFVGLKAGIYRLSQSGS